MLNLSRRQGWLSSVDQITKENLRFWKNSGATHIVGNLNWEETYIPITQVEKKQNLRKILCENMTQQRCIFDSNQSYLIKLDDVIE